MHSHGLDEKGKRRAESDNKEAGECGARVCVLCCLCVVCIVFSAAACVPVGVGMAGNRGNQPIDDWSNNQPTHNNTNNKTQSLPPLACVCGGIGVYPSRVEEKLRLVGPAALTVGTLQKQSTQQRETNTTTHTHTHKHQYTTQHTTHHPTRFGSVIVRSAFVRKRLLFTFWQFLPPFEQLPSPPTRLDSLLASPPLSSLSR